VPGRRILDGIPRRVYLVGPPSGARAPSDGCHRPSLPLIAGEPPHRAAARCGRRTAPAIARRSWRGRPSHRDGERHAHRQPQRSGASRHRRRSARHAHGRRDRRGAPVHPRRARARTLRAPDPVVRVSRPRGTRDPGGGGGPHARSRAGSRAPEARRDRRDHRLPPTRACDGVAGRGGHGQSRPRARPGGYRADAAAGRGAPGRPGDAERRQQLQRERGRVQRAREPQAPRAGGRPRRERADRGRPGMAGAEPGGLRDPGRAGEGAGLRALRRQRVRRRPQHPHAIDPAVARDPPDAGGGRALHAPPRRAAGERLPGPALGVQRAG